MGNGGPITKRIVCLANSRMRRGRCIAGKELVNGVPACWIRPVNECGSEGVSVAGDLRVLDIIDVRLSRPTPNDHQQENWSLGLGGLTWSKQGRWKNLEQLLDPVGPLWIDEHCTRDGINNKIPRAMIKNLNSSLRFILVDSLTLSISSHSRGRVQGYFQHNDNKYQLRVTDPRYERTNFMKSDKSREIGRSFLTVSLTGSPYDDDHYHKLIAAIIPRGGGAAM